MLHNSSFRMMFNIHVLVNVPIAQIKELHTPQKIHPMHVFLLARPFHLILAFTSILMLVLEMTVHIQTPMHTTQQCLLIDIIVHVNVRITLIKCSPIQQSILQKHVYNHARPFFEAFVGHRLFTHVSGHTVRISTLMKT